MVVTVYYKIRSNLNEGLGGTKTKHVNTRHRQHKPRRPRSSKSKSTLS